MVQGVCCATILGFDSKRGGGDRVFFLEGEGGACRRTVIRSTGFFDELGGFEVEGSFRATVISSPSSCLKFAGFFSKPRCQIVCPFSLLPSVVQVLSSDLYIAVMLHQSVQDRLIRM